MRPVIEPKFRERLKKAEELVKEARASDVKGTKEIEGGSTTLDGIEGRIKEGKEGLEKGNLPTNIYTYLSEIEFNIIRNKIAANKKKLNR